MNVHVHVGDLVQYEWGTSTVPGKVLSISKLGKSRLARVQISILGVHDEEIDTVQTTVPVEQLRTCAPSS